MAGFPGTNFTTPDTAAEALQSNLEAISGVSIGSKLNMDGVVLYALANLFDPTAANRYFASLSGNNAFTGTITSSGALTVTSGGVTVTAGGVTVTAGAITTADATGLGVGYATGSGGAVVQATNRSTGVTLNKISGTITTNNTSLAALAAATFTVTNSAVAIGDVILLSQRSGATNVKSIFQVTAVAAGSFNITLYNADASTAETGTAILNFAVIKAVSA